MITPALTRNERGLIIGDERNIGGAVETRAGKARRLAQEAHAQAQQFITPPNSPPQNIQPPQPQPVAQIHHQQFGLPQYFNINPPVFGTPESGYTTTESLSGFGRPYTEQEWRKKLCEGDDSLLQRKIDKIKERENKKIDKIKERENKKEKEKSRQRRLDAEYTKAKKKQEKIRFEALEEAFPDTEAKSKNITINPRPPPAKKAPSVPLTPAELRQRLITMTKAPAKKAVDLEIEKARDFVFNFTPKRYTEKYKREFNINASILMKPFEKEQDEIYEKLETQILGGNRYRDDARRMFDDIVRRATPYNEAQTIWILSHNRERVDVPLFKRYRELADKINEIPFYHSIKN